MFGNGLSGWEVGLVSLVDQTNQTNERNPTNHTNCDENRKV